MDAKILEALGQVAGIGGIALGVFLLLFRDVIRQKIFPQLTKNQAYRLLRLTLVLVWSVAVLGIAAWVWPGQEGEVTAGDHIDGDCSAINTGTLANANITVNCGETPDAN